MTAATVTVVASLIPTTAVAHADEPVTLAGSGPALWELLVEPGTVAQLATVLARDHAADAATIEADIVPVMQRLVDLGAVERA